MLTVSTLLHHLGILCSLQVVGDEAVGLLIVEWFRLRNEAAAVLFVELEADTAPYFQNSPLFTLLKWG